MRSDGLLALALMASALMAWAPDAEAQDLSRYRDFQLGADLRTIARQAGIQPDAEVIHARPALIQELVWRPRWDSLKATGDSASRVLFGFYNGQLFRVSVDYDRSRTEGLTDQDMITALSATYGTATLPAAAKSGADGLVRDRNTTLARWEDPQYAVVLTRPSYSSMFTLVLVARGSDVLTTIASAEAWQLDKNEAPQRTLDRQRDEATATRAQQDKARRTNIGTFRP
jgi:hypothetical protein